MCDLDDLFLNISYVRLFGNDWKVFVSRICWGVLFCLGISLA